MVSRTAAASGNISRSRATGLITSGTLDIGTGAPAKLAQTFPWGTYRLTITDPKIEALRVPIASIPAGRRARPATGPIAFRWRRTSRPTSRAKSRISRSSRQRTARRWSSSPATAFISSQLIDAPAGGATHRHSGLGRLGRGRLCARHALSPAQRRDGPRARALHRRGLAGRRQFRAHADAADRRPGQDHAAPAHHHSRHREGLGRRRSRPISRSPRWTKAFCSSPISNRPIPSAIISASAGSASACMTITAG